MARSDSPILIVGQGIAGTILGFEANERGIPFKILDDGHRSASSLAAAGLYNPFILKRSKLSWKAEEFFPSSRKFYQVLENYLGKGFDHEIGLVRRVHDVAEYNDWTSKEDDSVIAAFLGPAILSEEVHDKIDSPYGYRKVPRAGYVDIEVFLNESKRWFIENGKFIEGIFDQDKVDLERELRYESKAYSTIVVATGYRSRETSRFFGQLPFAPAKGHTMTIHCSQLELNTIVSGPCFIIPLGNGKFRIGSTYSWSDLNETVEGKELDKLVENFRSMCELPFEIIESKAGVRPATKDRRPIIGASQIDARVQIFGGMGSRAIMCAPLLAEVFLEHLQTGNPLWSEIDIKRFDRNQQIPV